MQRPEEQNSSKTHVKNRRKRKGKFTQNKKRKKVLQKNNKLAVSMSAWAEQFTVAATWQLKHQLAYWKAKAKALEYENQVLHDIIRKKHEEPGEDSESDEETTQNKETQSDEETESDSEENDDGEFVVSEEFIEFLKQNAKYKEEARLERERLKAERLAEEEMQEQGPQTKEEIRSPQDLYGVQWQRITALEMSLQSDFIDKSDKDGTKYWPNIPFNFNFS